MTKRLLFILLAGTIILTGCQAKQASSSASPTYNVTAKLQTSALPTATVSPKTSAPPSQLDGLESNSEDIIDVVTNNDWTAAQSKISEIKTNFSELKPILVSASVSTSIIDGIGSAIDRLEAAVGAKKSYDSKVQANLISKYIPDVYDYYTVTIPTAVTRLDYLGREIIMNVESSDWTSASSNYSIASGLWSGLQTALNTTYKKDVDIFQSNLDALKAAIDKKESTETANQANALLENVDLLETDFMSLNKT